jgi:hypothetical protein
VLGVQHAGFGVMMSRASFAIDSSTMKGLEVQIECP